MFLQETAEKKWKTKDMTKEWKSGALYFPEQAELQSESLFLSYVS